MKRAGPNACESVRGRFDLVLICPHLGPGGAQSVAVRLARHWVEQGRRILLVTLFEKETIYALQPSLPHVPLRARVSSGRLRTWIRNFLKDHLPGFYAFQVRGRRRIDRMRDAVVEAIKERLLRWVQRRKGGLFLPLIEKYLIHRYMGWRIRDLRAILNRADAPVTLAFCGSTNLMTILANEKSGRRVIISER
ncbi:MAG: hypothetical protein AAF492_29380, partial [Verrucomicrobiota bacterium]